MRVRELAVVLLLLVPFVAHAGTLGNIGSNASFVAKSSLAAMQNLGNGTFSNGERVTGVDIRLGSKDGNLLNEEIRSFVADSSGAGSFNTSGYLTTVNGEHVYHFDFVTPFVPDPAKCYTLIFYQASSAGSLATTTFYGWSTDMYQASSTGCHSQYASDDINTALQNSALNGHGLIDYSFLIYTEPLAVPPTISGLGQFRQFGVDTVAEGATFVGNAAVFKATIADADSSEVKIEVEVKPIGTAFDGAGTVFSELAAAGELSVSDDELIPIAEHYVAGGNEKSFHWRARAVDAEGNTSEWQEFGADSLATDFTAKVVPLWTQVQSDFPGQSVTWFNTPYASGVDSQCGKSGAASIGSCGCAISSLVMIAKYHGIQNGIDGQAVSPLTINEWLKANDGYIGENFVSWAKAEEYLGISVDGEPHAVLALDRNNFKTTSTSVVDSYLDQFTPVIGFKASAGHYFVMDDTVSSPNGATYTVRDPRWYQTQTLDDTQNLANEVKAYGNSFTHATIFTKLPSPTKIAAHTELYLASPAELFVTDPLGRRAGKDPTTNTTYDEIPNALYYLEDPVSTSDTELDPETIHHMKVLELPALTDGEYSVQVIGTGTGSYTLTSAMTDNSGSTSIATFSASTTPNEVTEYELQVVGGEPQDTELAPDALELIALLKTTIKESNLKPLVKAAFLVQVVAIEKSYNEGKIGQAKLLITALETEIKLLKKKNKIDIALADTLLAILAELKTII